MIHVVAVGRLSGEPTPGLISGKPSAHATMLVRGFKGESGFVQVLALVQPAARALLKLADGDPVVISGALGVTPDHGGSSKLLARRVSLLPAAVLDDEAADAGAGRIAVKIHPAAQQLLDEAEGPEPFRPRVAP